MLKALWTGWLRQRPPPRFELPYNVICLNDPAVERRRLLKKEPPGAPGVERLAQLIDLWAYRHLRADPVRHPHLGRAGRRGVRFGAR
jgi:hypothetical protein